MNQISIVIADDHPIIREGLRQLLELDDEIKVIGEAGNGYQCLKLIDEIHPDVLLLDINMPDMNGLEVLEALRIKRSKQKVLILTIHNETEYMMKAISIGVNGYLLKDSDSAVIKRAIKAIHSGNEFIDATMLPYLKDKIQTTETKSIQILTRREIEVLKLLSEGLFNKEIADRLCISEKTVKNHISNLFKKIGVSDRTQAAVYAIKSNIVNLF